MSEFGVELPRGWRTMLPQAAIALDSASSPVPTMQQRQLRLQLMEIRSWIAYYRGARPMSPQWPKRTRWPPDLAPTDPRADL